MTKGAHACRLWLGGLLLSVATGCASIDRVETSAAQSPAPAVQAAPALMPERRDALLDQADKTLETGRLHEAYAVYQHVLSHEPNNARAWIGMSEAHLAGGNLDVALAGFERVDPETPYIAAVHQGRGLVLLRLGRTAEARELLALAVQQDAGLWRAWNALGSIHDMAGDWDAAEDSYRRALALKPESAAVRNNLAMSQFMRGQLEEAVASFREAMRLDPELKPIRANLRLALAAQGRYLEALTGVYGAEIPMTLNNIGVIAMQKGEYSLAESYFIQAIRTSPSHYDRADRNLSFLRKLADAENDQ